MNPSPVMPEQSLATNPRSGPVLSSQRSNYLANSHSGHIPEAFPHRGRDDAHHSTRQDVALDEATPVPGAAGTATRTLREQISLLQKTNTELERRQKLKDSENDSLRSRIVRLEALMMEDVESCSPTANSDVNSQLRMPLSKEESFNRPNLEQVLPTALFASPSKTEGNYGQSNDSASDGALESTGAQDSASTSCAPNGILAAEQRVEEFPSPTSVSLTLSPHTVSPVGGSRRASTGHHQVQATRAMRDADLLRKELARSKETYVTLLQDYGGLEHTLRDVQRTASGYAARYAFCLLDDDNDGLIGFEEVVRYELFLSYPISTLHHFYKHWHFSAVKGRMTSEDFLNFTQFAEDKTNRASQLFWFCCADMDGDGWINKHDMRWFYDQVDKSGGCIGFEDLYSQLVDMAGAKHPHRGIALQDLHRSKLATGIFGLIFNHNNLLLRRTTAEFSLRNEVPM